MDIHYKLKTIKLSIDYPESTTPGGEQFGGTATIKKRRFNIFF